MGNAHPHKLYEDEYYVILQDDDRKNITLIMPARRVALEFTFDEWQNLRDIVAGIEIPGCYGRRTGVAV